MGSGKPRKDVYHTYQYIFRTQNGVECSVNVRARGVAEAERFARHDVVILYAKPIGEKVKPKDLQLISRARLEVCAGCGGLRRAAAPKGYGAA